jgi:2-polyprenyl-3-methyl-5-hydroxy-6-metoxy-1,4-benzoquinol methylase
MCVVCGSNQWVDLPQVGPQSMASDWRILPEPLQKRACAVCGLVSSATPARAGFFERGYSLYAHPPSASQREHRRQQLYARWIAHAYRRAAQSLQPQEVLEVGCGNGSLLLALGDEWPSATLAGCDPSAEAVAHASAAGCRVWQGTASSLPTDRQVDLVVSVNVIEHFDDPLAFLRDLGRRLNRDGMLVLICPDGARPGVELLIADHTYSFASSHLAKILEQVRLRPRHLEPAPTDLGSFQMVIADNAPASPTPTVRAAIQGSNLRAYLERWSALDGQLLPRLGDGGVSCFGVGETAGLLRAYAPRTWQRVRSCTADEITEPSRFGQVPAVPLDQLADDEPVLLGVRPQDQPGLVERLSSRFAHVVSWHDLIEA